MEYWRSYRGLSLGKKPHIIFKSINFSLHTESKMYLNFVYDLLIQIFKKCMNIFFIDYLQFMYTPSKYYLVLKYKKNLNTLIAMKMDYIFQLLLQFYTNNLNVFFWFLSIHVCWCNQYVKMFSEKKNKNLTNRVVALYIV